LIGEARTSEFETIDRHSAILRCERKDITSSSFDLDQDKTKALKKTYSDGQ